MAAVCSICLNLLTEKGDELSETLQHQQQPRKSPIKRARIEHDDVMQLKVTPCGHLFHKMCLNDWFTKGKKTCPNCMTNISRPKLLKTVYITATEEEICNKCDEVKKLVDELTKEKAEVTREVELVKGEKAKQEAALTRAIQEKNDMQRRLEDQKQNEATKLLQEKAREKAERDKDEIIKKFKLTEKERDRIQVGLTNALENGRKKEIEIRELEKSIKENKDAVAENLRRQLDTAQEALKGLGDDKRKLEEDVKKLQLQENNAKLEEEKRKHDRRFEEVVNENLKLQIQMATEREKAEETEEKWRDLEERHMLLMLDMDDLAKKNLQSQERANIMEGQIASLQVETARSDQINAQLHQIREILDNNELNG